MECYDFLKEIEHAIAQLDVWEIRYWCRARSGNNGNRKDSHGDDALDSAHYEQNSEHLSTEDSNPHGRISHLLGIGAEAMFVREFRSTSGQLTGVLV